MDGIHDLGGRTGYGTVDRSDEDEVFHARWEASVFAMVNAAAFAGAFHNADQFRHAIERVDPEAYLAHGYYGRWLGGIENLLVEAGLIDPAALNERAHELGADPNDLLAARPDPDQAFAAEGSRQPTAYRESQGTPAFQVGDYVRTSGSGKPGHTRLPAYARGRIGQVIADHGCWVYPDTNAHGQGEMPQFLYTVRFTSEELWGEPGFSVTLDLFEPYLEEAEADG